MASYFSPNLTGNDIVPSSGGISDDGSWSTGHSQDYFDASVEQLRGSPATRPRHLFGRSAEDLEEPVEEIPSRFDLVRKQQVPMEERRKMPGCGINEFDLFDNPIRAEFFQPGPKAYERPRQPNRRHRYPPSYLYGTAAVLPVVPSQALSSIPTYVPAARLQRSPHASPSSSSSSSPLPAYEDFQPGLQSSFLGTPPHQRYPIRENQVEEHPAFVPSYNVYPPENYYPSPSSSSPPSDQSVFERTPEPSPGIVLRAAERVFEDMFPTLSQEDGAPHEPDSEEYDDGGFGVHEHDAFESYYGGSSFCSFQ